MCQRVCVAGASFVFDKDDRLIIMGGTANDADFRNVWTSTVSFNDSSLLAKHCNISSTSVIPLYPGLQCWPPNVICPNSTALDTTFNSILFDSGTMSSRSTRIVRPNGYPVATNVDTQPRSILMSGSGSLTCILREDRSIVCVDPVRTAVSSSQSLYCPWSLNTTYQFFIFFYIQMKVY